MQIGDSPALGRFVSLRDAYGNTYMYAELGDVAALYPVLEPHVTAARPAHAVAPARRQRTGAERPGDRRRAATLAAVSEGAAISGLALGAAAGLEVGPGRRRSAAAPRGRRRRASRPANVRVVHRRRQRRLSAPAARRRAGDRGHGARPRRRRHSRWCVPGARSDGRPHIVFQIRPAGSGRAADRPEADPRRLGGAREHARSSGRRARTRSSPPRRRWGRCCSSQSSSSSRRCCMTAASGWAAAARQDVAGGQRGQARARDARVPVGLRPAPDGLRPAAARPGAGGARGQRARERERRDASTSPPSTGSRSPDTRAPGSIADTTVRKLLMLQGLARPQRIVSLMSYPGAAGRARRVRAPATRSMSASARSARRRARRRASTSALTPSEWIKLIARLGEIPDPTVAQRAARPAAIPDSAGASSAAKKDRLMATTSPPSPPAAPPPPPPAVRPAPRAPAPERHGRDSGGSSRVGALGLVVLIVALLVSPAASGANYKLIFTEADQLVRGDQVAGRRRAGGQRHEHRADARLQGAKSRSTSNGSLTPLHEGTVAQVRVPSLSSVANRYIALVAGAEQQPRAARPARRCRRAPREK